jgi:anti-anti-sigma factor
MTPRIRIEMKRRYGCTVVIFPANVELRTTELVQSLLFKKLGTITGPVIVDLKNINALRSIEMRILVKLKVLTQQLKFPMFLMHVSDECTKELEATNFNRLTHILHSFKELKIYKYLPP